MSSVPMLHRRSLLAAGAALSLAPRLLRAAAPVESPILRLVARKAEVPLVGGEVPPTPCWTFDGMVPGPLLRARQGETLRVEVENQLDEPTTVHWHGLRVPVAMDGVPYFSQPPIAPGGRFLYELPLLDAGTFWYHPHINSGEQVERGLHGALIIEEAVPPEVDRELVWVLDDWRLQADARIAPFGDGHDASHGGRIGNSATINGQMPERVLLHGGERLRLRAINVANARIMALHWPKGFAVWQMALDGQPTDPLRLDDGRVLLAPAQRVDLLIDVPASSPVPLQLVDDAYGRGAYVLASLEIEPGAQLDHPPPGRLADNPVPKPDLTQPELHRLVLEGGAMGGMAEAMMGGRMMGMREIAEAGRFWALNGEVAADMRGMQPLFRLGLNKSHVIEIENRTAFAHPMHLHGMSFVVLTDERRPIRDTLLVLPREVARIALVADNPGKWMLHCHVLEHQDAGMMGVVEVA